MLVTVQEMTSEGLMWRRVLWNVFTGQLSSESHAVVDQGGEGQGHCPANLQLTLNTCEWTPATEEHSTTGIETRGLTQPLRGGGGGGEGS